MLLLPINIISNFLSILAYDSDGHLSGSATPCAEMLTISMKFCSFKYLKPLNIIS